MHLSSYIYQIIINIILLINFYILILPQLIYMFSIKRNNFSRYLNLVIKQSYVSHSELEKIKKGYDDTSVGKAKMWMAYFTHRIKTGGTHMKQQVQYYWKQLKHVQNPTPLELARIYRIRNDIRKLFPVFFIYMLPFSPMFFVIYIKYFPDSLPTWFQVDHEFNQRHQIYRINKIKAINQLKDVDIDYDNADLKILKLIAISLTGKAIDGTHILNSIAGKKLFTFEEYPLAALSKYLLKRQIKHSLKNDPYLHNTNLTSINQKIKFKLGSISEF